MRVLGAMWFYLWAGPNTLLGAMAALLALPGGGSLRWEARGDLRHRRLILEAHGGWLGWLLRNAMPVRAGIAAATLGHVILAACLDDLEHWREHELAHVRQYEAWGALFLPAYALAALGLKLLSRDGYRDNPFEFQANRLSAPGRRAATSP